MARLKCWERSGRNEWEGHNHRVMIFKTDTIGIKGKWVTGRVRPSGTFTAIAKPSNTRTQAVKKAKSYMKKHDRCRIQFS